METLPAARLSQSRSFTVTPRAFGSAWWCRAQYGKYWKALVRITQPASAVLYLGSLRKRRIRSPVPLLSTGILAASGNNSGTCGEKATWVYDDTTKTLTISGEGRIGSGNFYSLDKKEVKVITFNGSFTEIVSNTFYGFTGITSITISDGVTTIGGDSFSYCTNLSHVSIPASVTDLGYTANFAGCPLLTTAGPSGGNYNFEYGWAEKIPDRAFAGLTQLKSVTFPASVKTIGAYAFSGCSSITKISIPASAFRLGSSVGSEYGLFSGCTSLQEISVEQGNAQYASQDGAQCH